VDAMQNLLLFKMSVSQNIVYFLGGMTKNVNFPQDFLVPSESY
jgi:hypothetical protein